MNKPFYTTTNIFKKKNAISVLKTLFYYSMNDGSLKNDTLTTAYY